MLDPKGPAFLCKPTVLLQGAWSVPGGGVAGYPGCFPTSWLLSLRIEKEMDVLQEGKRESNGQLSFWSERARIPFCWSCCTHSRAFSQRWPAWSAFGELLVKWGRGGWKEAGAELGNSPWSHTAETTGPKSPLPFEKAQDGRNWQCFCV